MTYSSSAYFSPVTNLNVTILGLGSFAVTSPGEFLSAVNFVDAIDDNSGDLLLTMSDAALSGYDLKSSIGPIVSASGYGGVGAFVTTAGLQTGSAGGPFTFSALASAPEPAEWALLSLGLVLIFAKKRMRLP